MAEIKLGPQDDDEQTPQEAKAVFEQAYLLELITEKVRPTYGPMSRRRAVRLAADMLYNIEGEVAIRIAPISAMGEEEE